MPEVIFYNDVFLSRDDARKICYAIDSAARCIGKDERLRLSIVDDDVVIETKDTETFVRL